MFMWWQLRLLTVALRGCPSSTVLLTRPVQFLFIHSCLGLNYFSTLILSGWELGRFNFIFHAGTAGAGYLLNYAAFPYFYQFGNSHCLLCPLQSLFSWDTADWRLLLFSGVQHGWHEPGHSVSPVWTLPCSTFLSPSMLLSHEHAAFKCTSLSLDCSHYTCWFLYLKLFPRLLLALHPLSQRQDCLTEAFADWPCQLLYPILSYHDSRWQIKFSKDGHRNVSHHTCSSDYVTLQLLPLSGGRSVSAS